MGIVNGTTNYILTRMTEAGASYADALAEAQALGLRRGRSHRRRGGLRRRRQGGDHRQHRVRRLGGGRATCTTRASPASPRPTSRSADRLGYVIKLLGGGRAVAPPGEIGVRVHPAMVPVDHPLASVRDELQRRVRRGRLGGRPHVLRAGGRGRSHGQRRARRPDRRRRQPAARARTPRWAGSARP